MTGSLAYRKNQAAIHRGDIPSKYTRLLPHITGQRVLEIGSAEGVLALLLAKRGFDVAAIERSADRCDVALDLRDCWAKQDDRLNGVRFFRGDVRDNLFLLNEADTLVAVRMIYYLGNDLDTVFAEVAKHVPNVVLCGNRNRADAWRAGRPHEPLGEMNRYAASEGMTELLVRHGYTITEEVTDGDEIVVGTMDRPEAHQVQNIAA